MASWPIGWVDAVLLAILLVSVVVGIARGFVFELLSLVGWVAAWFAAQWLSPLIAPALPIGNPGSGLNAAAAFVLAFVIALVVWALAARLVRLLLHATPLSGPDRLLGAGFGALRAVVLGLALTMAILMTPLARSPSWQQSQGAHSLQAALLVLKPVLPPALSQHLPRT